ncbi:hypothetical protein PGT21_002353 [Puccinia graminis f. sp. tritici]|uniref:Uncharacterized protein n=1 Tax=Puccinia graminis f. sp. tritici TaxID=56615 RepID=A0A5B0N345_PUCGR|nr:hypothetical protein PGT21_002353 [Puccinia graminis f. sp. tritici]KAA1133698.1 hypothetical protein PGTUg99_031694 [Puccinia graminis f. sp. tritici]
MFHASNPRRTPDQLNTSFGILNPVGRGWMEIYGTRNVTWCDSAAAQPAGGDYICLLRATPTGIHTDIQTHAPTGYEPLRHLVNRYQLR